MPNVTMRVGDARDLILDVPDGSVDLVATSPPYLALRSYLPNGHPAKAREMGSERSPAAFIDALLDLTAQFRRVLAPHGSIAIELGDTYAGSGGHGGDYEAGGWRDGQPKFIGSATVSRHRGRTEVPRNRAGGGRGGWPLERSLCMVPELYRVALAYGLNPLTGEESPAGRWRVRNVVTHGRSNPPVGAPGGKMRPACSTWAVACVERRWFDEDALRGAPSDNAHARPRVGVVRQPTTGKPADDERRGGNFSTLDTIHTTDGSYALDWIDDRYDEDLWTIPTAPYRGAHYATFSPELVRRFIVSMCPARVCTECGKPSTRMVTAKGIGKASVRNRNMAQRAVGPLSSTFVPDYAERTTVGWSDCGHDSWRPGLALDPFGGSGTTGMVAAGNGRDALLFDLDDRCLDLARERCGLFLDVQHPGREPDRVADGSGA